MTDHIADQTFSDWFDGILADEERAALEQHLVACASCRAAAAEWRQTIDHLHSAPRTVEPAHDLWPALQHRLVRGPAGSEHRTARAQWWTRSTSLAAAAALLVALSSGATAYLMQRADERADVTAAAAGDRPSVLAEEAYRHVAAQLFESYAARRDELAPATVQVVERSLRVIDAAIAEARDALARDPANRAVAEMLEASYRHKIDFLRRTAELPSRS